MHETLTLPFKGNRDYIQGTSLFNSVIEAAARLGLEAGTVNLTFKHVIRNSACTLEQRPPSPEDAVVAKLSDQNGESITLCINESVEPGQTNRQEFNEPEVCRGAVVGDGNIVQESPHHQDRIELLVSLCKKMHLECVDGAKKWAFSRYEGQFPIPTPNKVEIKITKQVGTRLTCSDVLIDDRKIGNIYFS